MAALRDVSERKLAPTAGALPPHDLDAEGVVLSEAINHRHTFEISRTLLEPGDFYSDDNGRVFRALLELADAGEPLEGPRVRAALRGRVSERYLEDLEYRIPGVAHVRPYAIRVRQLAGRRRVIAVLDLLRCESYQQDVGDHHEWLEHITTEVGRTARAAATSLDVATIGACAGMAYRDTDAEADARTEKPGIRTGLTDLDVLMAGGASGLTIISGPRGGGKTALAITIVNNIYASDPTAVVPIFSFEMPGIQYGRRVLASAARVDSARIIAPERLTDADRTRLAAVVDRVVAMPAPIWDDPKRARISWIRSTLRAAVLEHRGRGRNVPCAIVDCLQIIGARNELPTDANREQEVSHVARELKILSDELGVAVLLLAHENKAGNVRESGAAEYHADNVWRIKLGKPDARISFDTAVRIEATITISKQRGGIGKAATSAWFFPQFSRYES